MTQETMINQASDRESEKTAENINQTSCTQTPAKTFTQEQVETLIADRIKRERKVNESLIPVKQVLNQLRDKGLLEGKSYSEIAENLISKLTSDGKDTYAAVSETAKKVQEVKESDCGVCSSAENEEQDTTLTEEEKSFVGEENGQKRETAEQKAEACEPVSDMQALYDFKQKHPEADMNMIFDGDMFRCFTNGKSGSLTQLCEDYCTFISKLRAMNVPKAESFVKTSGDDDNGTVQGGFSPMNSTAFSSMSGTSASPADGLTKQQMEIAKNGGLSYREYAELLSSIPNKNSLR